MEFINQSAFIADKSIGSTSDIEQVMTVSLKLTLTWDDAGNTYSLPKDAWWPLNHAAADYAGVALNPDFDYRRRHVDLIVFGKARTPGRQALQSMQVRVSSGQFSRGYTVTGDRSWKQNGRDWAASAPLPFESMPLTNDRAFGGAYVGEAGACAYPMNPSGKGFALSDTKLDAVQLPNIERPESLITSWKDQPVPACFHKPLGGLLLSTTGASSWEGLVATNKGNEIDRNAWGKVMLRSSIPQSPPDFVVPRGGLGSNLTLSGFSHHGDMQIALPVEQAVPDHAGPTVRVEVGASKSCFPLAISSLLFVVEQRLLVVLYSASFRYGIYPGEVRNSTLTWSGDREFGQAQAGVSQRVTHGR